MKMEMYLMAAAFTLSHRTHKTGLCVLIHNQGSSGAHDAGVNFEATWPGFVVFLSAWLCNRFCKPSVTCLNVDFYFSEFPKVFIP